MPCSRYWYEDLTSQLKDILRKWPRREHLKVVLKLGLEGIFHGRSRRTSGNRIPAAFLLTVGSFLLTVGLLCLQFYFLAFNLQFELFRLQLKLLY